MASTHDTFESTSVAINFFLEDYPTRRLAIKASPLSIEDLKQLFASAHLPPDGNISEKDLVSTLSTSRMGAAFDSASAAKGFFAATSPPGGSGSRTQGDFISYLERMHTYRVLRVAQFDLNELNKDKGKYDEKENLSFEDLGKLLMQTGLGDGFAARTIDRIKQQSVGNPTSISLKGLARWYFRQVFPAQGNAYTKNATATPITAVPNFETGKGQLMQLVENIEKCQTVEGAGKMGSEANAKLHYAVGMIDGALKINSALFEGNNEAASKIMPSDEASDKMQKVIEKCGDYGVDLGVN